MKVMTPDEMSVWNEFIGHVHTLKECADELFKSDHPDKALGDMTRNRVGQLLSDLVDGHIAPPPTDAQITGDINIECTGCRISMMDVVETYQPLDGDTNLDECERVVYSQTFIVKGLDQCVVGVLRSIDADDEEFECQTNEIIIYKAGRLIAVVDGKDLYDTYGGIIEESVGDKFEDYLALCLVDKLELPHGTVVNVDIATFHDACANASIDHII